MSFARFNDLVNVPRLSSIIRAASRKKKGEEGGGGKGGNGEIRETRSVFPARGETRGGVPRDAKGEERKACWKGEIKKMERGG